MAYDLGEKLKFLRKERDLTQEQLAERLGVSFQAVSKWETNAATPDISMFPVLANFYGVTTDELLGVDITKAAEKVDWYEQEMIRLRGEWKLAEAVELARLACAEFPGNDDLRFWLAHCLEAAQNVYRTKKENLTEATMLLQKILETSRDTNRRLSCFAMLARLSHYGGDDEKALEYAKQLPHLSQTYPYTVVDMGLKKGTDRVEYVRWFIGRCYDAIQKAVESVCGVWPYTYDPALQPQTQIAFLDSLLSLQSLIHGDELLSENINAVFYSYTKAALYCRVGETEKALDELEKAVVYAEKFRDYDENAHYTSTLQRGQTTSPRTLWSHSAFADLWDEFFDSGKEKYALLHGNPRFEAILAQVQAAVAAESHAKDA